MNVKCPVKVTCVVVISTIIIFVFVLMTYYADVSKYKQCLKNTFEFEVSTKVTDKTRQDEQFLKNILEIEVPLEKSIFFLDTLFYFLESKNIKITARAACAIESAARWHPQRQIFILYAIRGDIKVEPAPLEKYIQLLSTYDNIRFGYINVEEFGKGTPVESLIMKKTIELSEYKVAHTSDLLRILTLWRYGGIYFDTDVIVLKSFDDLAENFFGLESIGDAANGVLGFSQKGVGHNYLESVLNIFAKKYNFKAWSANGPVLFSDLAKRVCKVDKVEETVGRECDKLHIYPPEFFYPVYYPSWKLYFEDKHSKKVEEMTKKLSSGEKIPINSSVPYLNIARKNCPRIISAVQDYF